jgi:hypothetical protein
MNDKHIATYITEPDIIDIYRCSCGWESKPYYDGAEFAYQEWKRHVAESQDEDTKERTNAGSQTTGDERHQ